MTIEAYASQWLAGDGPAALCRKDWLMPAERHGSPINPATFAAPKGGEKIYVVDEYLDGDRRVKSALIDSLGSQANRTEPAFKTPELAKLVPQVVVVAGGHEVNLLDMGHRAADALVRYSALAPDLSAAFAALAATGDARQMARIAPTSLVFGAWDSRGTTGVKMARMVRSTIRAWDVDVLTRAMQYFPKAPVEDLAILDNRTSEEYEAASSLGFLHAPSRKPGGVLVRGEIRRDALLNLTALRSIGPFGSEGDALRDYLLGLALVAFTLPGPYDLREGCLLVPDPERPPATEVVGHDGVRTPVALASADVRAFAFRAADRFGVGPNRTVQFDQLAARRGIAEKMGVAAPEALPVRGRRKAK